MKKKFALYLLLIILLFKVTDLQAHVYTWTGHFLSTSGNWNDATNWSSADGGVTYPQTGDTAFLPDLLVSYTVTLTANAICANIAASSLISGGIFINSNGFALTVSNDISVGSTAALSTSILTFLGSGAVSLSQVDVGTPLGLIGVLNFGSSTDHTTNVNISGSVVSLYGPLILLGLPSSINNNGALSVTGTTVNCYYFSQFNNFSGGVVTTSGSNYKLFNVSATLNNFGTFNVGGATTQNTIFTLSDATSLITNNNAINNYGYFNAGTSIAACTINLSGTYAKINNATTFNSTTYPGVFNLSSISVIHPSSMTASINNSTNGVFTIMSDANGSGTIGQLGSGAVITGQYNVQRFITGGAGYRGYRLLSSPVNISKNTAGSGKMGLKYINTNTTTGTIYGALTGGPLGVTNGFTVANNNPTMYFYDESLNSNNSSFSAGKNAGVVKVITDSTFSVLSAGATTTQSAPVGNGYLFYFIGDTHLTTTAATRIPENTTITAIGFINQNNVKVKFWKTPTSTSLSYTTGTGTGVAGGTAIPGLNQVGNPYASTISLKQLYLDNNVGANVINPNFYELDDKTQSYLIYNANTGLTNSTRAGKYAVSGQGFIMGVTGAGQTLTFRESEKVDTNLTNTILTPGMLFALKPTQAKVLVGLHLMLSKDSLINMQTGIYFSTAWPDKFNLFEDAIDINGLYSTILLSSLTSDGRRVAINSMGDYIAGKRIKLFVTAKATAQYNLKLLDITNIDPIYSVFLLDKLTKDSVNLRTATYNFMINPADTSTFGANRFEHAIELKALPPYKLISLKGQKVDEKIQLEWKTTNESYYTGFSIEKQSGKKFNTIDSLQSSGKGSYSFNDINVINGANNYRLKQTDAAGIVTYSSVAVNSDTDGTISVYPNPAHESVNVDINLEQTAYKLAVYNSMGALIKLVAISGNAWTENVNSYSPGTYIVLVNDEKGNFIGKTKFVKVQ